MAENEIIDEMKSLKDKIMRMGQDVELEIAKMEEELKSWKEENKILLEKIMVIDKRIIEEETKKVDLLSRRQAVLVATYKQEYLSLGSVKLTSPPTGVARQGEPRIHPTRNEIPVEIPRGTHQHVSLLQSSKAKDENVQEKKEVTLGQVLTDLPQSVIPQTCSGTLEDKGIVLQDGKSGMRNTGGGNTNAEIPEGNLTAESSTIDESWKWKRNIEMGIEHYRSSWIPEFKELMTVYPEDLNNVNKKDSFQVKSDIGDEHSIVCSAILKEMLVIGTADSLFVYMLNYSNLKESTLLSKSKTENSVSCVAIQSKDVVIFSSDKELFLLTVKTKETAFIHEFSSKPRALKFHPNSAYVVAILDTGGWSLINTLESTLLKTQDTKAVISGFDIHPNGGLLATCSCDGSIEIWNFLTGKPVSPSPCAELNGLKSIKFLKNGNKVCVSSDKVVGLLDYKDDVKQPSYHKTTTKIIQQMDMEPTGRVLCYSSDEKLSIMTTFRKGSGGITDYSLREVRDIDVTDQIVHFTFVEGALVVLLLTGEIVMYKFS